MKTCGEAGSASSGGVRLTPVAPDVAPGEGAVIFHSDLVNLYGCPIGDDTKIRAFVEIQKSAHVGRWCKISSPSFVREGVTIEVT